ncbi:MAG: DUF1800 domain-containing protein [Tepidisphaeraceae bacterium]
MAGIHPLLAPYQPSDSDPFDRMKAAHLLNRAGFGGTPQEVDRVLSLGPERSVDWLMDFPDAPAEEQSQSDAPDLSGIQGVPTSFREIQMQLAGKTPDERKALQQQIMAANRDTTNATIQWWLNRMAAGAYPLQEKLTFFWHGHFTTSANDERQAMLMWRQNELQRRYAAGNFEPFVRAISRDPAMLDYLNNNQNRKEHPNENYARELMELFTLGIGNYTEDDIKQAARAFTGWGHDGEDFVFRRGDHDYGEKTFFGRTGNFDGDDIITLILRNPACPKFIAGELYKWFATDDIEPALAQSLGDVLYDNQYEMRPLIRTILTSQGFYSPQVIGSQIKCPVQLVVGTVRLLNVQMPPLQQTRGYLTQMGQMPFSPPNVRGWPGGHMWINTNTLFVRYNTGLALAGGPLPVLDRITPKGQDSGRPLAARDLRPSNFDPGSIDIADATPEEIAQAWVDRLIQRPIDKDKMDVLIDAAGDGPLGNPPARRVVQLIVSMPEYQLC